MGEGRRDLLCAIRYTPEEQPRYGPGTWQRVTGETPMMPIGTVANPRLIYFAYLAAPILADAPGSYEAGGRR